MARTPACKYDIATMTINDFANCLNDNSQIDCIFLDFSKRSTGFHATDISETEIRRKS